MVGVLGVIISLILLMYLAYKGMSVLILAPMLAILAVFISGDVPVIASYTETFMKAFAAYVKAYFPLFLLGAIFGKVMDVSGAAKVISHSIAEKFGIDSVILAVVLSCAILTYGGVSLFVVAFAVYPVAAALFKKAGVPKRFIPAAIGLGSFTFTMTALPGTPQIQNAIPMPYFETTTWAAPFLGIIGAIVMFGGGMLWLNRRAKSAMASGEGYGNHKDENIEDSNLENLPSVLIAIVPIVVVLFLNFLLGEYYFANADGSYLKEFGTTLAKVKGTWSIIISLIVAILLALILFYKNIKDKKDAINSGAVSSLLPIINTASVVGYGNVIKSLGAFILIKEVLLAMPGTPLISLATSTSVLAGITGSASGGMSIALSALGDVYMQKAIALGINPEAFHRIAAMACGGLDSLPQNGAVITLFVITGLSHKESYADLGVVTVIIPIIATAVAIFFATLGVV